MALQNALYIEALQDIDPGILAAAVKYMIANSERFPKPAEIRKAAQEIAERREVLQASRRLAEGAAGENFLARCKRVFGRDAVWLRERHHLIERAFDAHCRGALTDEALRLAVHGPALTAAE